MRDAQAARHGIIDEPRQLLDRHVVGRNREIGDRLDESLELVDLRLENTLGQFATDAIDCVLDLVDGGVDVLPDLELDLGQAAAFRRC
jgi:hypothetical protein